MSFKLLCGRCEKDVMPEVRTIMSKDDKKMFKAVCPICKKYIKWLSPKEMYLFVREKERIRVMKSDNRFFDKYK